MERSWRVFHSALPHEPEATIELDSGESHHVRRVLRRRTGDSIRVFDGRGRERSGVIESVSGRVVRVRLGPEVASAVEAPLEVVLYQGLCRPERMEWVIQKATELGVGTVFAMATERADAAPPSPARLDRWRRIATEACKQCGRRWVPKVELLEQPPPAESDTTAIVFAEDLEARPLGAILAAPPRGPVWLAVGPESGLSDAELSRYVERGWSRAHLGPRTLRTETAGIVACAIVLYQWGDVGRGAG